MRIAVIGTGIAGLGAAYLLSRAHEVEVFERNGYAGGHTNTVEIAVGGRRLPLDTGFLVHNERNYPNLVRLFRELGVRTQESEMSFSVSCARCGLEYSGRRPFAQPENALRPGFARLLLDILRFLRSSRRALEEGWLEGLTLARFVEQERYGREFRDHFLVPLTAALWSTAPGLALEFPIAHAVRFFDNHGMLGFRRFRWRTVVGGSRTYVGAITDHFGDRLHLHAEVLSVRRDAGGAAVETVQREIRRFDKVVIATHPDEALRLLADPSDDERRILGAFPTTRSDTVLHTDDRFLPRSRAARASWNYQLANCRSPSGMPTMTYYLNRLQGLDEREHYCVTLNRSDEIAEDRVIERIVYEHPLYTLEGVRAQSDLPRLAGARHTYYCGAYHGFGFHEDGLVSGVRVAEALGVSW